MAISDKLNYLIETKQLFKDRLNSLGAEIIESTTFRNYLTWLDTFYGEVSNKTDISQNGVVGRTSQNTAILPSEYTQVDYIESSGTQYIDTGYSFNNNLNVDISFQGLNNENAYYGVFGARESNNTSRFAISYQASSKKIAFNYGSVDTGAINNTDVETNKVVVYNEGLKFYLNNENIRTFSDGCGEGTRNCLLFTFRNIDNSLYRQSSIKLYYLKMYDNGVLIRDFIPCYRNSDNEVGLYDLVNDVFYTNQGTGVFTYGSVVSIPNPDYPQPINNLSGDVAYKITTQNGEQTFTIPLGDIELCKIGNYEDKIYSSDGRFYLNKNINKVILNGSESGWTLYSYNSTNNKSQIYVPMSDAYIPAENKNVCISNYFKGSYWTNYWVRVNEIFLGVAGTAQKKIWCTPVGYSNINDFKTWLSTHNTTVYYVLATPTTTEITQENYPSLYNALKQIQDYLTAYKINKEFILGYSSPEIEY